FQFFHRDKPEYTKAVFRSWDDPDNKELEAEVEKQDALAYNESSQTTDLEMIKQYLASNDKSCNVIYENDTLKFFHTDFEEISVGFMAIYAENLMYNL